MENVFGNGTKCLGNGTSVSVGLSLCGTEVERSNFYFTVMSLWEDMFLRWVEHNPLNSLASLVMGVSCLQASACVCGVGKDTIAFQV